MSCHAMVSNIRKENVRTYTRREHVQLWNTRVGSMYSYGTHASGACAAMEHTVCISLDSLDTAFLRCIGILCLLIGHVHQLVLGTSWSSVRAGIGVCAGSGGGWTSVGGQNVHVVVKDSAAACVWVEQRRTWKSSIHTTVGVVLCWIRGVFWLGPPASEV